MKLTIIACMCLVMCAGCTVPYEQMSFYPGYDSIVENEGERAYALMLHQTGTDTTFRATVGENQIPSPLAGSSKTLQFAIPTNQLGSRRSWDLADLGACCVGMAYVLGAGIIQQGTVTIGGQDEEVIVLTIESSQLDKRFQGEHKFKRSLPYTKGHRVREWGFGEH